MSQKVIIMIYMSVSSVNIKLRILGQRMGDKDKRCIKMKLDILFIKKENLGLFKKGSQKEFNKNVTY